MLSGAGHSQLKEDAKLPFGEKNAKSYAEGLYEKYSDESVRQEEHSLKSSWYSEPTNILGDYNKYYKLAEKFGALNAPYAKSEKQGKSESESDNTIRVTLRNEDTFFAARHVYVSNYLCELEYIKDQDISTKLDNIQIINLDDKKAVLSKVQRELGF